MICIAHTAARSIQEHGWSLEMVQAQFGHRSIVTAQRAYAFLELQQRLHRAGICAGMAA